MSNSEFFGLNLEELPDYVRYFGSNNVEGVAESSVKTEMSWMEVDELGGDWNELGGGENELGGGGCTV